MTRKRPDKKILQGMGSRIKDLREKQGISGPKFAYETGISYVSYLRYENGQAEPGAVYLGRAAERLGTSIDYLVLGSQRESLEVKTDRLWSEYGSGLETKSKIQLTYEDKREILIALGVWFGKTATIEQLKSGGGGFMIKKKILEKLGLWQI